MSGQFFDLYQQKLTSGELETHAAQAEAAKTLGQLEENLLHYRPEQRSFLGGWFAPKMDPRRVPKGLYLYGGVGCGKTMLMDLFFETIDFRLKARYHFNEFMYLTHDRLDKYRKSNEREPIIKVASEIAKRSKFICFDEFYVSDIADAMILGRLFTALFDEGVVVLATSNTKISNLYKNGLNRQLFLPFIELMQSRMVSHELISDIDFRLRQLEGERLYFVPNDRAADEAMCSLWQKVTGVAEGKQATIIVKGRPLLVPESASGAARFNFADLCVQALGRDDYLALAKRYHTIFIEDIPVMGPEKRDQARRFITLIDTLYDGAIRLIASASASPDQLYKEGDNAQLFERTTSRLMEMQYATHLSSETGD
jgi:cell division protein ZapE